MSISQVRHAARQQLAAQSVQRSAQVEGASDCAAAKHQSDVGGLARGGSGAKVALDLESNREVDALDSLGRAEIGNSGVADLHPEALVPGIEDQATDQAVGEAESWEGVGEEEEKFRDITVTVTDHDNFDNKSITWNPSTPLQRSFGQWLDVQFRQGACTASEASENADWRKLFIELRWDIAEIRAHKAEPKPRLPVIQKCALKHAHIEYSDWVYLERIGSEPDCFPTIVVSQMSALGGGWRRADGQGEVFTSWILALPSAEDAMAWTTSMAAALEARKAQATAPSEVVYWKRKAGETRARGQVITQQFRPYTTELSKPGPRSVMAPAAASRTEHAVENRVIAPQNFTAAPAIPESPPPPPILPDRIVQAAKKGKKKRVKKFTKQYGSGWDKVMSEDGDTLLHVAMAARKLDVLEWLIRELGGDANTRSKSGKTPLYVAAVSGNAHAVHLLVSCGANIHLADDEHVTPLAAAAAGIQSETASALVVLGADVNAPDIRGITPFFTACAQGSVPIAKHCLAEASPPPDIHVVSHRGQTALVAAAQRGMSGTVELLLRVGADPNHQCDPTGHTPLHSVSDIVDKIEENVRAAQLLVAFGARLEIEDRQWRSALHAAVENSNAQILKVLLAAAPREKVQYLLRRKSTEGASPLDTATAHGDPSVLEALESEVYWDDLGEYLDARKLGPYALAFHEQGIDTIGQLQFFSLRSENLDTIGMSPEHAEQLMTEYPC